MLCAARTLHEHPEVSRERPIAWPRTRPRCHPHEVPETVSYYTLAAGLRDLRVIGVLLGGKCGAFFAQAARRSPL